MVIKNTAQQSRIIENLINGTNGITDSIGRLGLFDHSSNQKTSNIIYASCNIDELTTSVFAVAENSIKGYSYDILSEAYIDVFLNADAWDRQLSRISEFNGLSFTRIVNLYNDYDYTAPNLKIKTIISFNNGDYGCIVCDNFCTYVYYVTTKLTYLLTMDYRVNNSLLKLKTNLLYQFSNKLIGSKLS